MAGNSELYCVVLYSKFLVMLTININVYVIVIHVFSDCLCTGILEFFYT